MLKREMVWRHLADSVLEDAETVFHQREIAATLAMSVGNVHLAIAPLRAVGAVAMVGKRLVVRDVKKVLQVWAARRTPPRPIASLSSGETAERTIALLPPHLALTSFAGYVVRYGEAPAPLSVVRCYAGPDSEGTAEARRRFTSVEPAFATVVVYEADEILARDLPDIVGPSQLYVDMWNEADFFAADYLRNLERKLRL